jgi:uncharacterized protein YdeI (YjbR/CyaY-like superfamily)
MGPPKPRFFRSPAELRAWLEKNHARAKELWVGFHRTSTGKASLTWSQAVDEALCFGWIDGIRKSIDGERYTNRFTPRNPRSHWSAINVKKIEALVAEGRMMPAGLAAWEKRDPERTAVYSFEQRPRELEPAQEKRLRASAKAWAFFAKQAPWYRRVAIHWIASAKKPETRERRLGVLVDCCARGVGIPPLAGREKR